MQTRRISLNQPFSDISVRCSPKAGREESERATDMPEHLKLTPFFPFVHTRTYVNARLISATGTLHSVAGARARVRALCAYGEREIRESSNEAGIPPHSWGKEEV